MGLILRLFRMGNFKKLIILFLLTLTGIFLGLAGLELVQLSRTLLLYFGAGLVVISVLNYLLD